MLTKRQFLLSGSSALGLAALGGVFAMFRMTASAATEETFEITKSEEEWRKILTPAQFDVLRDHGTERAFTSPLNDEKRAGLFHCAGCDLPVYSSETKFDSGTGWPSFYQPLDNAVGTSTDTKFFMTRTEVHCRRCGGHLGHVFDDGPPPTGKRHCINGVAMTFHPGTTPSS
jgi:peptide-methionine (R)-S-oxide reductase